MKFPKYKLEFNKKIIFIYKSYAQSKLHPKSDLVVAQVSQRSAASRLT